MTHIPRRSGLRSTWLAARSCWQCNDRERLYSRLRPSHHASATLAHAHRTPPIVPLTEWPTISLHEVIGLPCGLQCSTDNHVRASFSRSRSARIVSRICLREAMAAWVNRPCFHREARIRSMPSGVRGPVLGPPCILHRPFDIAGPLHAMPFLVRAPHRGALSGLPGRLPFLSRPRPAQRVAWGLLAIAASPPGLVPPTL